MIPIDNVVWKLILPLFHSRSKFKGIMKFFVTVITCGCVIFQTANCQATEAKIAECILQGNLTGTIRLEMNGSETMVSGTVSGKGWKLTPGNHGFHIHEV